MSKKEITLIADRIYTTEKFSIDLDIKWKKRDAVIKSGDGVVKFQQKNVEFPEFWSDNAVNIVSEKYFRGQLNTDNRENSLKQVVNRIVDTITQCGVEDDYFSSEEESSIFKDELKYMMCNQIFSFNSPVWFNVGVEDNFQAAACFINDVDDSMESIMDLVKTEAMIFKGGSGAGVNLSKLRGRNEYLSGGGKSSGPVSFMRGFDSFAGIIKSGGKNRRAAKIVHLDCTHPDIIEFVRSKMIEDQKARALIAQGYSPKFEDENGAYSSVAFQNENHTVCVTNDFMESVIDNDDWDLINIKDGKINKIKAQELFKEMCVAAHACGDPGLMFIDEANKYHTYPNFGMIKGSNPCQEILEPPNSACNLASINLIKFVSFNDGKIKFDYKKFIEVCKIVSLAQEILIDNSSYPTEKITKIDKYGNVYIPERVMTFKSFNKK